RRLRRDGEGDGGDRRRRRPDRGRDLDGRRLRAPYGRSRQRRGDGVSKWRAEHAAQHQSRPRGVHREGRRAVRDTGRRARRRGADPPRPARSAGARSHDRAHPSGSAGEVMRPRAMLAWIAYLVPATALALYAVGRWLVAFADRTAVLYGEGAVANAAGLARAGVAYLDVDPQRFVAANYPPLYFHLASIGDPFISGRIASIAATLMVAVIVFGAARPAGAAVAVVAAAVTVYLDSVPDVWRHVVTWNALSWSTEQALSVAIIALMVVGLPILIAAFMRGFGGARAAYLAGAVAIVVAAGREGATINYLLDLTVAVMLALAAIAAKLRTSALIPLALLAQVVVGTLVLDPLGVLPGRVPTTGAWSDPFRAGAVDLAFHQDGHYLVEDSGLLARTGISPVVDDLFLWSRLVDRGLISADPIVNQVR